MTISASRVTTAEPSQTVGRTTRPWEIPAEVTRSLFRGWLGYLRQAGSRDIGPWGFVEDAAEFWRAATVREEPQWTTDHTVRIIWPQARLLDFSTGDDAAVVPTLLLPPQAGHASTVADYSAEQSQIRFAQQAGLTQILALDWLPATEATMNSSIEDYLAIIDESVDSLGGKVNLIGDCQGGWLATIYAALHPDNINTLAMGGAPIDFHAGDAAAARWMERLQFGDQGMGLYRLLVALGGGVHRGQRQIDFFKMLEPTSEISRLSQLWANIGDPRYVQRHIDFTNWFEWAQDVPGAFYLWIVEHLFKNNELVKGELIIDGQTVDLSKISSPLYLIAGTKDHITPAPQQFALSDYVSTPAGDITQDLVDAGHLGLFMGRSALREHWTPVMQDMASRSQVAAAN